jgi:hypothetical protein
MASSEKDGGRCPGLCRMDWVIKRRGKDEKTKEKEARSKKHTHAS